MVSAIIPCHNYGKYIDFAVDSVLDQTYKDIEIIVVNDGSTDEFTNQKLANYDKPRTRVINRNQGYPAAARNTGFEHAKGEFILLLDSDDLFESSFAEKALQLMETNPAVGAVSSYVLNFGYDSIWKPLGGTVESFLFDINCPCAALVRRKAWEDAGGFNPAFVDGYEDWNFWIDVTKRGWTIDVIPELLFYYRRKSCSRVAETAGLRHEIYKKIISTHPDVFAQLNNAVI
jgi:glycosyltransferase involved in cell wall biosynthesis